MKSLKPLLLIISFLFLILIGTSFAHDTDLYTASGAGVEPNILIMFDNSGSMAGTVRAYYYDPAITYEGLVVPIANRNTVYYQQSWGRWTLFKNGILEVPCATARTALTNKGMFQGPTNASCNGGTKTLRTGNYRNYLASVGGTEYVTKLSIAKTVVKNFLDTINGVRVGVMVFNMMRLPRLFPHFQFIMSYTEPAPGPEAHPGGAEKKAGGGARTVSGEQ